MGVLLTRTQDVLGGVDLDGAAAVMAYAGFCKARNRAAPGRCMTSAGTLSKRGLRGVVADVDADEVEAEDVCDGASCV